MNEEEEICGQGFVYSTCHAETTKIIENFTEIRKAFGYNTPVKVWFTDNCCDEKFISETIPALNDISPPPLLPLNDTSIHMIEVSGKSLANDHNYAAFLNDYNFSLQGPGKSHVGFDCEWEMNSNAISLMQICFNESIPFPILAH
jgi:hypothetical protein